MLPIVLKTQNKKILKMSKSKKGILCNHTHILIEDILRCHKVGFDASKTLVKRKN